MELADVIILPGSKQTTDDLRWLRECGFEPALREHACKQRLIVGICGGFQMLGEEIADPNGLERAGTELALHLLPVSTIMERDKITIPARGIVNGDTLFGQPIGHCEVCGYEIHLGNTEYLGESKPFASITRRGDGAHTLSDGCVSRDGRIFGTYLHGLFDSDAFRHAFLRASRAALEMSAPVELAAWSERRKEQLDLLADAFGGALDLDATFAVAGLERETPLGPRFKEPFIA
jgi:adenosylcobyric acid synthase